MQLKFKFNYGFITLGERAGGTAPVCLRNGGTEHLKWLGFIDSELARQIDGARPVKIKAARYCDDSIGYKWNDLGEGEFVQGCALEGGVYGVYQASVRTVETKLAGQTEPPKQSRNVKSLHDPRSVSESKIYGKNIV